MRSDDDGRSLWYDVGWPVLAGTISAGGVLAAYAEIGLLGCVAAFLLLELTVAPTGWTLLTDMGRPGLPAVVELAPVCALATVVTLGLVAPAAPAGARDLPAARPTSSRSTGVSLRVAPGRDPPTLRGDRRLRLRARGRRPPAAAGLTPTRVT